MQGSSIRVLVLLACGILPTAAPTAVFAQSGQTAPAAGSPSLQKPQAPPNDAQRDEQRTAMRKFDPMIGSWTGAGWMMTGPGKRAEFTQTEIVQRKVEGTLITIEGEGRNKTDPGKVAHSAFGVLAYDPAKQQYRFLAFSGGRSLEVAPEVGEHSWRWGFDMPYGKVRFTLDFSTGEWREFGEISRDGGQSWQKNFEMTLKRKP